MLSGGAGSLGRAVTEASAVEGSKQQALDNARRLLARDPTAAERQARIIVDGDPECADAQAILGLSLRRQGRVEEALAAEQSAIDLSMLQPELFEALMSLTLHE